MNRRLYRSRTDTVLGGVASGLAVYLNTDPALVRIAWAILVPLTGGAMFLAYIVAWIVVPEEPYPGAAAGAPSPGFTTPESPSTGSAAPAAEVGGGGEPEASPVSSWPPQPAPHRNDNRAGMLIGIGLVVLGVWFLLRPYLPDISWSLIWPLAIVAVGGLILITAARRSS